MRVRLTELAGWTGGALRGSDREVRGVMTDTRRRCEDSVFFAIRGERFDAHDFVGAARAAGAVAAVVERALPEDIPQIVVPDVRRAFGAAAGAWRARFAVPVVAVAGSNGKTTTTQMVASVLAAAFGEEGRLATRGNFNNEIGVPLTLWRLADGHRAAVVEAGMNHPGEMAWLARLIAPTVALVNNAQREHQEFMDGVEATARENGAVIEALPPGGVACFPADDGCAAIWRAAAGGRRTVTWARRGPADVTADWRLGETGSDLAVRTPAGDFPLRLALVGEHNVHNALGAVAVGVALGLPLEAVRQGLEAFRAVRGRGSRKTLPGGAVLIDESYNANPDSMRAAIDVLAPFGERAVLVAGDMGEVGARGAEYHREIGRYCARRGVGRMLCVGPAMREAAAACGPRAEHFADVAALTAAARRLATPGAVILVKASHSVGLERVVAALSEENHAS